MLAGLKSGCLAFLFTVDKLSERVDVPEVNMVLFLRPTQSLTVFLQQLGRGPGHAPDKECQTAIAERMDGGNIPDPVTGECPDLIANPRLLETACNTVEQMGLINTLCRGYYAGVTG